MHHSLTLDRIAQATEESFSTLSNPGFCRACGEEAFNCEPDARNYDCECCGESEVFGAMELLLEVG